MILQRLKHFVVIIIFADIKFQLLIPQAIFGIGNILCQHTSKFSCLFIHGKYCLIIVQKSYLDTPMFFHPGLFFARKTLFIIKCKILLIQICLKERTIIDGDGTRRLRKKEEVENSSEVLLNPSDPEATFRYKAGGKNLGYVGNDRSVAYFKTEEFSKYARFRNGVEAIPSLLRRRYHVDKIPTHGKNRNGIKTTKEVICNIVNPQA